MREEKEKKDIETLQKIISERLIHDMSVNDMKNFYKGILNEIMKELRMDVDNMNKIFDKYEQQYLRSLFEQLRTQFVTNDKKFEKKMNHHNLLITSEIIQECRRGLFGFSICRGNNNLHGKKEHTVMKSV